jgi:hypothetical protein
MIYEQGKGRYRPRYGFRGTDQDLPDDGQYCNLGQKNGHAQFQIRWNHVLPPLRHFFRILQVPGERTSRRIREIMTRGRFSRKSILQSPSRISLSKTGSRERETRGDIMRMGRMAENIPKMRPVSAGLPVPKSRSQENLRNRPCRFNARRILRMPGMRA